jgi:fibrillarin-like rRNA methylase
MKHVGEAISSASLDPDKKIVVLGIANWTTVSNNQDLIKKNVQILL